MKRRCSICRARGLTLRDARDMLIHAYAGEVLEGISIESLRHQLERELFVQLDRDLADHATRLTSFARATAVRQVQRKQ